jgi:hypothetical protein
MMGWNLAPFPWGGQKAGVFRPYKIKWLELLPKILRAVTTKTVIGFARPTIHHIQKTEGESLGTEHADRT